MQKNSLYVYVSCVQFLFARFRRTRAFDILRTEAILQKKKEAKLIRRIFRLSVQAEKEARVREREERKAKIRESKEKKGGARVGGGENEENMNNTNKDSTEDPNEANEGSVDATSAIVDENADSASEDESEEDSADESDDDDDDSDDDDDAPLPREWPRSKSQLIVDKVSS